MSGRDPIDYIAQNVCQASRFVPAFGVEADVVSCYMEWFKELVADTDCRVVGTILLGVPEIGLDLR